MLKQIKILSLAFLAIVLAAFFYLSNYLDSPMPLDRELTLVLQPGDHLRKVTSNLGNEQHIRHPYLLYLYGRLSGKGRRIQVGEYLLLPGMSHRQLLDKLVSGDVVQNSYTLVEGWNFYQMMQQLQYEEKLVNTLKDMDRQEVMEALGYPEDHGEGEFAPDTYYFTSATTDREILTQAFERQAAILAEEWQDREDGLPYQTPYDALIMASIVEKETGVPSERAEIAGVFVRRLQKGMRLQTDPTIIYGLGPDFDGNIRRIHLRQKTPYNTYVIRGLPPTPIAMPGREAIHAALHPAQGNTLYFVARGDGSHKFSETLAEHEAAVREFQLKRVDNYRSAPAPQ